MQVRSLSGAPHCQHECRGAWWRSAYALINSQLVTFVLVALCLVVALALWPPDVARAAPAAACLSGLPADLATQLEPLVQALGEATGQSSNCASLQPGASGEDSPSQRQGDLQLIAETLALLALADPSYGYSNAAPGYGYSSPDYGYPGPADGYPGPADGYPGPADGYPGPADGYPGFGATPASPTTARAIEPAIAPAIEPATAAAIEPASAATPEPAAAPGCTGPT